MLGRADLILRNADTGTKKSASSKINSNKISIIQETAKSATKLFY
jgi:hypothetical protein